MYASQLSLGCFRAKVQKHFPESEGCRHVGQEPALLLAAGKRSQAQIAKLTRRSGPAGNQFAEGLGGWRHAGPEIRVRPDSQGCGGGKRWWIGQQVSRG